jgi:hypothetical protein
VLFLLNFKFFFQHIFLLVLIYTEKYEKLIHEIQMNSFIENVLPITLITSVGLTYTIFVMFSLAYILYAYVPTFTIHYVILLTIILISSILGICYLYKNMESGYLKIFGILTLFGSVLFSGIYLLFYLSDKLGFPLIYPQFSK